MLRILAVSAIALAAPVAVLAAVPDAAKTYVKQAGAGDKFEIESSKLELGSSNPQIRDFANKMIADHTTSTNEVKAAAAKAGYTAPAPMMTPDQKQMIAGLKAASGAARDQLYIADQKASHDQALAVQQGYATNGTVMPLQMAASKIVPVVQSHIQMLSTM